MSYHGQKIKNGIVVDPEKYLIDGKDHKELEKEYKRLQKLSEEINAINQNIGNIKERLIKEKYEACDQTLVVEYNRKGFESYYDWNSGMLITKNEANKYKAKIDTTSVNFEALVPLGRDLQAGAFLVGEYRCRIDYAKNLFKKSYVATKTIEIGKEEIFLNPSYTKNNQVDFKEDYVVDTLNKYYDFKYLGSFNGVQLTRRMRYNLNFEVVIKEIEDGEVQDMILLNDIQEVSPLNKMFGLSRPGLNKIKEAGLLKELVNYWTICKYKKISVMEFFKNEDELMEFLKKTRDFLEDLSFFKIDDGKRNLRYGNRYLSDIDPLLVTDSVYVLVETFLKTPIIKENLSFKRFYNYVFREMINQGYFSPSHLISELADYYQMCSDEGIKANPEPVNLTMIHNITSRNHKVLLSEIEEQKFKEIYSGDEHVEKINDKYLMVSPLSSSDVKIEGDQLGHCVASYIGKIIKGVCKIFFLRLKENESLVTVEVADGKIVQIRGARNRAAKTDEMDAIKIWARKHELLLQN